MGKLHQTYTLTITTLSPLHIGTGNILRLGYDFVTHNDHTWMIDAEALAAVLHDQDPSEFDRMVEGVPAGDLIRPSEFNPGSPLFRYVMRGTPRSVGRGAQVQELIKDPWDRPYIPGSSLKGAIRTALAVIGWEQRKLAFAPHMLGTNVRFAAQQMERHADIGHDHGQRRRANVRFAAQQMERQVLGGTPDKPGNAPNYELSSPPTRRAAHRDSPDKPGNAPNYELLRALQVSDSTPGEREHLQLLNVQVAVGEKSGSPIELEAVKANAVFTATLTLDGFLRQPGPAGKLGWEKDQLAWLKNVPKVVNAFTVHRIDEERRRWATSADPIKSFYENLNRLRQQLDIASEFLLQLGWGGGWDSKTFGRVLTQNPNQFAQVVEKYGKTMVRQGKYKPGDRYPKSRRVVVRGEQPQAPLGWVKVRMERVK